jgi:small-conductance mechanosensitive channel
MEESTELLQFIRAEGLVPAIGLLGLAWLVAGGVSRAFTNLSERFVDRRLALQQAKSILRLLVFVLGFAAAAASLFRLSSEAILALSGTIAVAIGFAFRDLLASIIAGVIILIDRPFQVGDRVTFDGYYGEVVEIGLRTVRLVTLDDSLITIPNNKFLTEAVSSSNAGALDMLIQIDFHIGIDQDLRKAKALVREALVACQFSYLAKPAVVVVAPVSIGDAAALRLRAKVYIIDLKYEKALESDVTERVIAAFQLHRVHPPAVLIRHTQAA